MSSTSTLVPDRRNAVWLPVLRLAGFAVLSLALVANLARAVLLATHGPGFDFDVYYDAARLGWTAGWQHVYDHSFTSAGIAVVLPARSPPLAIWLVAPLAMLPERVAYVAWLGLSLAMVAAAFTWVAPGRRWRLPYAVAIGSLFTLTYMLYLGQLSVVVVFSLALCWRLASRGHDVWAGMALSLALVKPHLAILVPVALLCSGRGRLFLGWVMAAATIAGASFLELGWAGSARYLDLILRQSGGETVYTMGALIGGIPHAVEQGLAIGLALLAAVRIGRHRPAAVMSAGMVGSALAASFWHFPDFAGFNLLAAAQVAEIPGLSTLFLLAWAAVNANALITGLTLIPGLVQVCLWLALEWAWLVWLLWTGGRNYKVGRLSQTIPSSHLASSDMRSGVHGGS